MISVAKLRFFRSKLNQTLHRWGQEWELRERFPTAKIEEGVQIKNHDLLALGENVMIQKGTVLHCGGMAWSNGKGGIRIGNSTGISPYCVLYGAGGISIGERCALGPGVIMLSSIEEYRTIKSQREHLLKEIRIGNDVFIGAGSFVNFGVTIGGGVLVYAGSIVTKDLPPNTVCRGIPAEPIGERR